MLTQSWDTSCQDCEERLLSGRSLVPELPLFQAEAAKALRVFKRLRLPDVIGTPDHGGGLRAVVLPDCSCAIRQL